MVLKIGSETLELAHKQSRKTFSGLRTRDKGLKTFIDNLPLCKSNCAMDLNLQRNKWQCYLAKRSLTVKC